MRAHGMPSATVLAMLAVGCFPQPAPEWVEQHAELLALRIEVDQAGELSDLVAPVPIDRHRVAALPGDRIRFTPWVLTPEAVLGDDEIDAVYFTCDPEGDCFTSLPTDDAMTACDATVPPPRPCMIGRGADARYTLPLPDTSTDAELALIQQVLVVAGEPDVRDTDDCVDALRNPPYHDLHGCMLLTRTIPLGPQWLLGVLLGTVTDPTELPPEVLLQWPNFNPELRQIAVSIDDRQFLANSGDRIDVRVGQRVRLTVVPDPRDTQMYAVEVSDGNVLRQSEGLTTSWWANGQIDTTTDDWADAPLLSWSSRVEGVVRFDVLLEDGQGGLAWGSIKFDIDAAAAPSG